MKKLGLALLAAAGLVAGCATNTTMNLGTPPQAMPATVARAPGKTEVLWLGHAATRITTPGGKVIVIDPWLTTNPKTPAEWKKLEALGHVDLILVTHAHFDHFDDLPALAKLTKAQVISPQGLQSTMISLGILPAEQAIRVGKSGTFMPFGPAGIKVTQVHAEHDSELTWTNPATGKRETHTGGEPVGYIIEMENGFKVYHTGDTGLFGDMRLIGDLYHPDVVLIPIGNHFVMSPQDAAVAARDMIRAKWAWPIHYGTTPQLRGTPAEFKAALGAAGNMMLVVDPGQKIDF